MNIDDDIKDIADFIGKQKYVAPFFVRSDALEASYKKFLVVLLQRHGAHKTALHDGARSFLDEAASDLSYALYLNALGFYKPARLSLRGAIENILRFSLKQQGVDPKPLSVSGTFDEVKNHVAYATAASSISTLKDCYAKLCRSSHTIDIQFMAQNIPFSDLVESDKGKFDSNLSDFGKVSGSICSLLYIACPEAITKLTPEQQDFVRGQIPKSIKKALLNS